MTRTPHRSLAAVASAAVLAGAAVAVAGDPPEDELARASRVLAEAAPLVEAACGAKFGRAPQVRLLTEDDAARAFADDLRPEIERRYPGATEGQRTTLLRAAASNAAQSCVARYSVTSRTIVLVRAGFERQRAALSVPAGALLRAALAHEAVHALDDARFDIGRLYREAPDDEALRARAMVVEGRATHFGRAVAAQLGVPGDRPELHLPGGRDVSGEREWTLRLTYGLGERFVAALVARGGTALADRALSEPPALTWTVCDASRWPGGRPDDAPSRVLAAAGFGAEGRPLSELQLRARYAALDGVERADALLAGFRGGAQALVESTNAAVLAFADDAGAKAFEQRQRDAGAPVGRLGRYVVRAEGENAAAVLTNLSAALAARDP